MPPHPLFQLTGVSRATVALDTLHLIDLGVSQLVVGGALKFLYSASSSPTQLLTELWAHVQAGFRQLGTALRLDRLVPSLFIKEPPSKEFACWRGTGAVTRRFSEALLFAIGRMPLEMTPFLARVISCLAALVALYKEIEPWRSQQVLSQQTASHMQAHIRDLQGHLSWLRLHQKPLGLFFNYTPKVHYLTHLGEAAKWLNPHWHHCYAEEDLIGRFIRVARQSAHGHTQKQVPSAVMSKYRVNLTLQWGGYM